MSKTFIPNATALPTILIAPLDSENKKPIMSSNGSTIFKSKSMSDINGHQNNASTSFKVNKFLDSQKTLIASPVTELLLNNRKIFSQYSLTSLFKTDLKKQNEIICDYRSSMYNFKTSKVLLNVNLEPNKKWVMVRSNSSKSILNMTKELSTSYSHHLSSTNDSNHMCLSKYSYLSLNKSTLSLNALDLDNISFISFDRDTLYSNCSDYLCIIDPSPNFDAVKDEVKTDIGAGSSDESIYINPLMTFQKIDELHARDGRINRLNNKLRDKVICWLLNT